MSPAAGVADHLVPPTAVRGRGGLVHLVRALAARRRRGVTVLGRPRIGRNFRVSAAPGARVVIEPGCVIGDHCRLEARGGELRLEAGATLGDGCTLVAHAGISIGPGAVLGERARIADFDQGIEDVERPIRSQAISAEPVAVGAGARIGHGATLLRGVAIPAGAVVGAHAVVERREERQAPRVR